MIAPGTEFEPKNRPASRRAVSLVELLISLSVMSLLSAATIFSVGNTTRVAREQAALARAEILDCGRRTYAFSRTDAAAVWAATPEAGRLPLLIQAGSVNVPADFLAAPGGYVLSLGGAISDGTVVRLNGAAITR